MNFTLHTGALAPKLSEQIKTQGFTCEKVDYYEKLLESRTYLYMGGYIPESTVKKIDARIFKKLCKDIKPNKQEANNE